MNSTEIQDVIKQYFEGDSSGHDFEHTLRVYRLAMKINEVEQGSEALIMWGSLLHDVDDDKLFDTKDYENARKIMHQFGVSETIQTQVIAIIQSVSFVGNDSVVPDTLEGKIVQDADRLDAIGAIGIARTFMYGGSKGSVMHIPDEQHLMDMDKTTYKKNKSTVINHFYEKLFLLKDMLNTETARSMAIHRHEVMEMFVEEFLDEWEGKR